VAVLALAGIAHAAVPENAHQALRAAGVRPRFVHAFAPGGAVCVPESEAAREPQVIVSEVRPRAVDLAGVLDDGIARVRDLRVVALGLELGPAVHPDVAAVDRRPRPGWQCERRHRRQVRLAAGAVGAVRGTGHPGLVGGTRGIDGPHSAAHAPGRRRARSKTQCRS